MLTFDSRSPQLRRWAVRSVERRNMHRVRGWMARLAQGKVKLGKGWKSVQSNDSVGDVCGCRDAMAGVVHAFGVHVWVSQAGRSPK